MHVTAIYINIMIVNCYSLVDIVRIFLSNKDRILISFKQIIHNIVNIIYLTHYILDIFQVLEIK